MFEVINADIPCILGVPFLEQVNPIIDWKQRLMKVKFGASKYVNVGLKVFGKSSSSSNYVNSSNVPKVADVAT